MLVWAGVSVVAQTLPVTFTVEKESYIYIIGK